MVGIAPSDIYPAVRRFLIESGLQRTLKAFNKETTAGEDDEEVVGKKHRGSRAKALQELELTAACSLWLETQVASSTTAPTNGAAAGTPAAEVADDEADAKAAKKRRKRLAAEAAAAEAQAAQGAAEEAAAPEAAEEAPPRKKSKKQRAAEAQAAEEAAPAAAAVEAEPAPAEPETTASTEEAPTKLGKKNKKEKAKPERNSGVPFSRVDHDKWISAIKDDRLKDNTHLAKNKYGGSMGDSWGDKAAEDLLKVKGKGFRKEMAKKKRSSWRGGGEIDQGVNSIKFSDSDDE